MGQDVDGSGYGEGPAHRDRISKRFVVREGAQVDMQARANARLVDVVKKVERATEIPAQAAA
jgi:hypothetical protein